MAATVAAGVIAAGTCGAATNYVSLSGSHGSPFSSWATAATNVHAALAIAGAGDTVMVGDGAYALTNQLALTAGITVTSLNGPAATTLYRNSAYTNRILMVSNVSVVVSGFTVTNGFLPSSAAGAGSAVLLYAGTISNCVVANTSRDSPYGQNGVVYLAGGRMTGCVVSNCYAYYGMMLVNGSAILEDSVVKYNGSADYGLLQLGGAAVIRRCHVFGNWASIGNGAAGVSMSGGRLENCLIYGNSAGGNNPAGGVYISGGAMVHCTVARNSKATSGAGIVRQYGGYLTNCIAYGNGTGAAGENYSGDIAACRYSCAPELTNSALGNVTLAPRLVDAAGGNFRLALGSPCLDAGTNLGDVVADIAGQSRPVAADAYGSVRHDMGAYEKAGATGSLEVGFTGSILSGFDSVTSVFTSRVAGANTTIAWYGWDFNNDGTYEQSGGGLANVSYTFGRGQYTVSLRVTNAIGEGAFVAYTNYILVSSSNMYVSPAGGHVAPYDTWAKAATNLNDAVDIAQPGCTIMVTNGSYRITKKIDLFKPLTLCSVNGPWVTTVWRDAAAGRFGLFDLRDAAAVLAGITMTNGNLYATAAGAAIYMTAGTVSNCVVARCLYEAGYAGSVWMSGGVMKQCVVTNVGHWYPILRVNGTAVVEDCVVVDSSCGEMGMMVIEGSAIVRRTWVNRISGSTPYVSVGSGTLLENCLIHNNTAAGPYLGPVGGLRVSGGRVVNCTIANNQRTGGTASGVKLESGVMTNCIMYGNGAGAPADNFSGSPAACAYSCAPELTNSAQKNVAMDPLFANAAAGDFRLKLGSACLDTGTNLAGVTTDLTGSARPLASDSSGRLRHDMGAYEKSGGSGPLEVGFTAAPVSGMNAVTSVLTAVVAGANTGISQWDWDFDNNGSVDQTGMGLSQVTHEFGPGLHSVALRVFNGSEWAGATNLNYVLVGAPNLYVSPVGGHVLPYASWATAATSLNAAVDIAVAGNVIHVTNGNYRLTRKLDLFSDVTVRSLNGPGVTTIYRDGSIPVFGMLDLRSPGATLAGFTVTNGGAVAQSALKMTDGLVSNCIVTKCDSRWEVGGMLNIAGGRLARCTVSNNFAFYVLGWFGGAGIVEDCRIADNSCGQYGLIQLTGNAIIRRTIIASNTASYDTAGVRMTGGRLENCLIYTNRAYAQDSRGGVGAVEMSAGALVNCTIVGNTKSSAVYPGAGGVMVSGGVVTNCIIYGNIGGVGVSNNYYGAASACWYTCCPELTGGLQGNITDAPSFRKPLEGDYNLARGSPCINAGALAGWDKNTDVDLAGNPRMKQDMVDMGAYESSPPAGTILIVR